MFEVRRRTPRPATLLFLMSATPKERFDLHKAAEDSHSRAQAGVILRANKAGGVANPTGEMTGPGWRTFRVAR
jgi:hypothetical protein